jgi:hypothetical protein
MFLLCLNEFCPQQTARRGLEERSPSIGGREGSEMARCAGFVETPLWWKCGRLEVTLRQDLMAREETQACWCLAYNMVWP